MECFYHEKKAATSTSGIRNRNNCSTYYLVQDINVLRNSKKLENYIFGGIGNE